MKRGITSYQKKKTGSGITPLPVFKHDFLAQVMPYPSGPSMRES